MSYSVRNNRQFYVQNTTGDITAKKNDTEAYIVAKGADGVMERSQIIPLDKVKKVTASKPSTLATKQKYFKVDKNATYGTTKFEISLQIKFRHYIYDGDDSTLDFITVAKGENYLDTMALELARDIYRDSIFNGMVDVYVDTNATVKDKKETAISASNALTTANGLSSALSLKKLEKADTVTGVSSIYIIPKQEKYDMARKNNDNPILLDILYKATVIKADDDDVEGAEYILGEVDMGVVNKASVAKNITATGFSFTDATERVRDMEYYYTAERGDKYRMNGDYLKTVPYSYLVDLTAKYSILDIEFSRHDFRESMEQPQKITIAVKETGDVITNATTLATALGFEL